MKGSKPRSGDFKMDGINSTAEHLFQVIPKLGKCQVLLHKHHLWCTGVPAAAQIQHPMLERRCVASYLWEQQCLWGKTNNKQTKEKTNSECSKKKKKLQKGHKRMQRDAIQLSYKPPPTVWCQRQGERKSSMVAWAVHKAGKPSHS